MNIHYSTALVGTVYIERFIDRACGVSYHGEVLSGRRPRVLIAEDHPGMLRSLERLLASDCDVVGTVDDGGGLLESARRLQPDVVIADLNMPTVSGFDACQQLIRWRPAMKVILVSGTDDGQLAEYALSVGAAAFLPKFALASGQLVETIRRVCAKCPTRPEPA